MSGGCLEGDLEFLEANGRCSDNVCNESGGWSVSRGCKQGLKRVLTILCPYLNFGKVRTVA